MGPDTTSTPYDAAIADVESRIKSMQNALETLKQLRASALGEPAPVAGTPSRSVDSEVQHDSFFQMTIADAARKYLTMKKATKSTADIAAALEQGGLKHSSTNFPNNVRAIIGQRDDFTRVPNGEWGLAEWYPGQGRGNKSKAERKAKVKRTKKRRGPKPSGATLESRILAHLATDPQKGWISSEVSNAIGAQRESVQSTMSRLAKEGKKITKVDKGYRLVRLGISAA